MGATRVDTQEIEAAAYALGAAWDQIPFIMSLTLNRAAQDTRNSLIEDTWPRSITQRNKSFIRRALRTKFSTKTELSVAIYDDLGRAALKKHAEGGTKVPKGSQLAVPSSNVRIGSSGVVQSQRPRALPTNKTFVRGQKIFMATGKGRTRRLKVMYFLKPSVPIPRDVPFYRDFSLSMRENVMRNLPGAVTKAMSTRRAR